MSVPWFPPATASEGGVNNGPILRSIIELGNVAKKLTPAQFTHHISNTKNDFAKWVDEVVRDSELAHQLKRVKTKKDMANAVMSRLKQLQKAIK